MKVNQLPTGIGPFLKPPTDLLCSVSAPKSGLSNVAKTGEPSAWLVHMQMALLAAASNVAGVASTTRDRVRRNTVSAHASRRCRSASSTAVASKRAQRSCNLVSTTCSMRCSSGITWRKRLASRSSPRRIAVEFGQQSKQLHTSRTGPFTLFTG